MTEKVNAVVLDLERYEELLEKERRLARLDAAGLDNWAGIDLTATISHDYKKETPDE